MSNVGKIIWTRGHKIKGVVTNESYRNCACCGYSPCLIVKWDDGKKTKPCISGIKYLNDGDLEIM